MKKSLQILALLFICLINAQAPEKFSYQAVIRNASNALVANSAVGVKISILKNSPAGAVVYAETQNANTNANGLISIQIGAGTVLSGSIASIDWSSDSYYIKTETDPTGGSNYSISGTSQLLSVPYAMYSKSSGSGASSFSLPYSGNSSTDNVIPFKITNSSASLSQAAYFENTDVVNSAPAITGKNNSVDRFGVGVQGIAKATSNGNLSSGVYGYLSGAETGGAGVYGVSQNAYGVYGLTTNGSAVRGDALGTGTAGSFQANSSNSYALVTYGPIKFLGVNEGVGKVLTYDSNGNATWQTPAAGLTLPYDGSSTADAIKFKISNTSTNPNQAGYFENININNIAPALMGVNNSTENIGIGVKGLANSNSSNQLSIGVSGEVTGPNPYGAGVYGYANSAIGVYGKTVSGFGISGSSSGYGIAGYFKSTGLGSAGVFIAPAVSLAIYSNGPLKFTNINEDDGKVLTSDSYGNATWQDVITPFIHISSLGGSAQAIDNSGLNTINSWTNLEETGGANYDATTGEYIIPVTGYYSIYAHISFTDLNTNNGDQAILVIRIDGSSVKKGYSNNAVALQYYSDPEVKLVKKLTAGQKVSFGVYQYGKEFNFLFPEGSTFSIDLLHK